MGENMLRYQLAYNIFIFSQQEACLMHYDKNSRYAFLLPMVLTVTSFPHFCFLFEVVLPMSRSLISNLQPLPNNWQHHHPIIDTKCLPNLDIFYQEMHRTNEISLQQIIGLLIHPLCFLKHHINHVTSVLKIYKDQPPDSLVWHPVS